jgi:RNA polymerase sigma-70 factor (ECF subfamily)
LDEGGAVASNDPSPHDAAAKSEQSLRIDQALAKVSYDQREVILLRLYGGMKFREIADLQDTSINTAKSRYNYGLKKMQSLLNGEVR